MAIAVTETRRWGGQGSIRSVGTLAFSGSYATGGDPVTLPKPGTTKEPYRVSIVGKSGFDYQYDHENKKVIVRGYSPTDATAGVIARQEIAAAAYPAGVTGDVIRYEAIWPLLG